MKPAKHICHLTTVHPRSDARILLKECTSLRKAGYLVTLIVADGLGNSTHEGVRIVDVGRHSQKRLVRVSVSQWRAARIAFAMHAEVYHFHDSELIPLGLALRIAGRKVIYDAHEDLARSFANRPWILPVLRPLFRLLADGVELGAARFFNGIVAATPMIGKRFERAVVVRNWPILTEFSENTKHPIANRSPHFIYVGSMAIERGALVMVEAVNHPLLAGRARLTICGNMDDSALRSTLDLADRSRLVDYTGHLNREGVVAALSAARAGLVVLQPNQAYRESLPVKMFEYLAAGLPVIASDFPLWRTLPGVCNQGLFVDPQSPDDIARAMRWILDHPDEATSRGMAGRTVALEHYSWASEEKALLRLYTWMLPPSAV